MGEIIVKYKTTKTLRILKDLAKYFDYVISSTATFEESELNINGVPIIAADNTVDASELETFFTKKKLDATVIRNQSWQRRK